MFTCVRSYLQRCSALPTGLPEVLALGQGGLHRWPGVGHSAARVPPGQHAKHFGQLTVGLSAIAPTGGPWAQYSVQHICWGSALAAWLSILQSQGGGQPKRRAVKCGALSCVQALQL